jgi:hypothetical protein
MHPHSLIDYLLIIFIIVYLVKKLKMRITTSLFFSLVPIISATIYWQTYKTTFSLFDFYALKDLFYLNYFFFSLLFIPILFYIFYFGYITYKAVKLTPKTFFSFFIILIYIYLLVA